MRTGNYSNNLKLVIYTENSIEYTKLYGQLDDGTDVRIEKQSSILSQADNDMLLLWYKDKKCIDIDNRTQELIFNGFAYDEVQFSLSKEAQINWLGLKVWFETGALSYPYEVSADNGTYNVSTSGDMDGFLNTAFGNKEYIVGTGRALKTSVSASSSVTEVNAITDNR